MPVLGPELVAIRALGTGMHGDGPSVMREGLQQVQVSGFPLVPMVVRAPEWQELVA